MSQITSDIRRQLKSMQEALVFAHTSFGDPGAQLLAEELSKEENCHVKILDVSHCKKLGPTGARSLGKMLTKKSSLTTLRLHELLNIGAKGLTHVISRVAQSRSLTCLEISQVGMTQDCVELLCEMLRSCQTLRKLDVSYNNLGDGAASVVETALQERRLAALNVAWNNSSQDCTGRICAALKSNNNCLRSINLSRSWFLDESLGLLVEALGCDRLLEELKLSWCYLGDQGGAKVLSALCENASLKLLDLSANDLGENSCWAAAKMLKKNSCLQTLVLGMNKDLAGRISHVCEAMRTNVSLTELSLNNCGLQKIDLESVAGMLRFNTTLVNLLLYTDCVCHEGIVDIANALTGCRNLRQLVWPNISDEENGSCATILLEGNGSITNCGYNKQFDYVCQRNKAMHERARQAVQTLRVLWLRKEEESLLQHLPKNLIRMIGDLIWISRAEVVVWTREM